MQNEQKSRRHQKQRHYHSHLPKGSYHSYCRQRFNEMQIQINSKINKTGRNLKSFQTNRENNFRPSPIDEAQTFQQYLERFQQPYKKQRHIMKRKLTADHEARRKNSSTKENKKQQNQQIIQSQLPYYRCKIDKSQPMQRKAGFRVKENKFKVVKNVVENNLINYMGHSMQLTGY